MLTRLRRRRELRQIRKTLAPVSDPPAAEGGPTRRPGRAVSGGGGFSPGWPGGTLGWVCLLLFVLGAALSAFLNKLAPAPPVP